MRSMALGKCVGLFVFLTFLWTSYQADTLDCALMESCILPCSFHIAEEVVIHWIKMTPTGTTAHSYYHNKNQFEFQDKHFKGRTSLFKDQISKGNASLRLTGVKLQDQGKYKCYISTISLNEESFITIDVYAPVRKVNIQQVENKITCSSEGIYPEPQLTWSANPPSTDTLTDTVQQTEEPLYNISSSLKVSVNVLEYSCTVSTRSNKRTATWFQQTSINGSMDETTINCAASNCTIRDFIWRFNHSQVIVNKTGGPCMVSQGWRQRVKSVCESGNLTLQDLSSNQEGIYTCELNNAEKTCITNTFLRIEERQDIRPAAAIASGVVISVVVAIGLILAVFYIKRNKKKKSKEEIAYEPQEAHPLR